MDFLGSTRVSEPTALATAYIDPDALTRVGVVAVDRVVARADGDDVFGHLPYRLSNEGTSPEKMWNETMCIVSVAGVQVTLYFTRSCCAIH